MGPTVTELRHAEGAASAETTRRCCRLCRHGGADRDRRNRRHEAEAARQPQAASRSLSGAAEYRVKCYQGANRPLGGYLPTWADGAKEAAEHACGEELTGGGAPAPSRNARFEGRPRCRAARPFGHDAGKFPIVIVFVHFGTACFQRFQRVRDAAAQKNTV